MSNHDDPFELLTEVEAAKALKFTPRFLQARRVRGDGPPFIRISCRAIRYRRADLEAWIDDHVCKNTSDPGSDAQQ